MREMRTYFGVFLVFVLSVIILSCSDESYRIEFNELDTGTSAGIRALHVVSADVIWASGTGGTYDKPELNDKIAAFSSDGGFNWSLSEIMPREYRSCVIWLQDDKKTIAFSIGKTGCDYSLDKGRTWISGTDAEGYYTARAGRGTLSGFAAGDEGKLAKFVVERVE